MAVKISELTASVALTSDDFFPVVDSGSLTTKRVFAEQVLNYITSSTFNTLTVTSLTGSSITGSLATFTTISASTANISGNLVLNGAANLSSYPDYAYIIYTASYDKLVVYPGLYVSGNLTGSGLGAFQTISASTYLGLPTSSGGTPGGTNTTIQFNDGGSFSGSSVLVFDKNTNELIGENIIATSVLKLSHSLGPVFSVDSPAADSIRLNADGSTNFLTIQNSPILTASLFTGPQTTFLGGVGSKMQILSNNLSINKPATNFANATLDVNGDAIISGNLTVGGRLTAQEYYTEVVSASIIYESGSTKFGNDSTDTHQFSGSILLSGTLTANNTISGTTAQFTIVSASSANVSGSLVIDGPVNLAQFPDYAYVLYTASFDKIVVYPGLYISGNLTGSGLGAFQTVSASTYLGLPTSSGGTPGGTNQTIQFNSGSTFSGSSNLVWDYTNNRLGIGISNPNATLHVNGNTIISGNLTVTGSTVFGSSSTTNHQFSGSVNISGTLTATAKSFDIVHPTKDGMRLRYGSLEGPENGVYVRGVATNNIIELPEHWTGLVDQDSITVNLTPFGSRQNIWVDKVENNKVYINGDLVKCYFTVFAERKDISKLVVEY